MTNISKVALSILASPTLKYIMWMYLHLPKIQRKGREYFCNYFCTFNNTYDINNNDIIIIILIMIMIIIPINL